MPRKTKSATAAMAALPQIPADLLDQLVTGSMTPGDIEDVMRGCWRRFTIDHPRRSIFDQCYSSGISGHS